MLDVVAGQDRDRPLGRELALQQRRADAADLLQGLGIGELAPAAGGIALRQEDPLGGGRGPVFEPLGQLRRIGRERVGRCEMDGAVAAALHRNVARAEANRSHRRRRGGFGTTLFDRCRHGASLGQVLLRKVLFRAGFLCTADRCTTLGARFSRNALSRDFASSSAWAIAEISASVR